MSLIDYKKPFNLPKGLKQLFKNDFNFKHVSKNVIINMKNQNRITNRDLSIAEFLFKVRFATFNQIYRFLGADINKNNLRNRLDKLVNYRILNKFTFSNEDESVVENLQVYCLDIGGRHLLEHYSDCDTTDWLTINNMKASELIGKHLLTTEFYVRLMETCPGKVQSFEIEPKFTCGNTAVKPNFAFSISTEGKKINFLGEVIRDYDLPEGFRKKSEKYHSILCTNAWKKYYKDADEAPVLLVFTDSDESLLEAAKIIADFTQIEKYRLSTDQRITHELYESGTFISYDAQLEQLKTAKVTVFKPE